MTDLPSLISFLRCFFWFEHCELDDLVAVDAPFVRAFVNNSATIANTTRSQWIYPISQRRPPRFVRVSAPPEWQNLTQRTRALPSDSGRGFTVPPVSLSITLNIQAVGRHFSFRRGSALDGEEGKILTWVNARRSSCSFFVSGAPYQFQLSKLQICILVGGRERRPNQ